VQLIVLVIIIGAVKLVIMDWINTVSQSNTIPPISLNKNTNNNNLFEFIFIWIKETFIIIIDAIVMLFLKFFQNGNNHYYNIIPSGNRILNSSIFPPRLTS
jgi:hypothetical protein